jgi:ornithine cyclodeaminase/alanine dehydrogenase-like protein (mu-crystallin family)
MAVPALRRLVSSRAFSARELDPETLTQLHTTLVDERQQLRREGAPAEELESNRLAIVQCQWELSQALIERYLPPAAAPSAA